MKQRPILFSAPMVRAILEGRKTQTRRLVKRRKDGELPLDFYDGMFWFADGEAFEMSSPYGDAGDRLWVKETWQSRCWTQTDAIHVERVLYAADRSMLDKYVTGDWNRPKAGLGDKFVTPLFMPRWASRILVENTEIRVQRLQDISEEDAKAEGADLWKFGQEQCLTSGERGASSPYRGGFACLWDEINADRATWKSNPWIRAITFNPILMEMQL